MEIVEKILLSVLNFALFVALSLIFLPAFLIVMLLQKPWEERLKGFGL